MPPWWEVCPSAAPHILAAVHVMATASILPELRQRSSSDPPFASSPIQGLAVTMKLPRRQRDRRALRDLTSLDRKVLSRLVQSGLTPQRVALRARIVLLAADGLSNGQVARRLEVNRQTVALWRRRFAEGGPDALLHDRAGRGRKPSQKRSS
jgi:DNA-binding CsgD family transcriptional regulator